MTDLEKAARQALEALEDIDGIDTETECVTIDVGDVITALRQALEQRCVCGEPDTPGTHRTDGPCLAEQPAQQQEPVAWVDLENWLTGTAWPDDVFSENQLNGWTPLYTTPPAAQPAVPLTDEQINLFINGRGDEDDEDYVEPTGDGFGLTDEDLVKLVRRVEAAHGIGEKK